MGYRWKSFRILFANVESNGRIQVYQWYHLSRELKWLLFLLATAHHSLWRIALKQFCHFHHLCPFHMQVEKHAVASLGDQYLDLCRKPYQESRRTRQSAQYSDLHTYQLLCPESITVANFSFNWSDMCFWMFQVLCLESLASKPSSTSHTCIHEQVAQTKSCFILHLMQMGIMVPRLWCVYQSGFSRETELIDV